VLVVYEAAGLRSEFASYLVRSLLSEGHLRYETVEKTPKGLRARLIERKGPTGLIVTTTAIKIHPENETRLLSVTISDSQDQTKAVLRQKAREKAGPPAASEDLDPWHALQEWLVRAEHRVTIPYAEALAELIPPVAIRLRRDFPALLALIETHALLQQAIRERTPQGAIIATLEDYGAVRELVADLMAEGVGTVVSAAVRETVTAVGALLQGKDDPDAAVSVTALAKALNIDRSTAWRRAQRALDGGYLHNEEKRNKRPARLVLGEPLPQDIQLLPLPDDPVLRCCMPNGGDTPPSPRPS